jgi:hypothetical protein
MEKDLQTILLRIYQSDSDLMVVLPQAVNGFLANATYGDGVLLLSMPKARAGETSRRAEIKLREINSTRGEWVGHEGSEIRPADQAASGS